MKDRQKKMLRFMLLHKGLLHIEDLSDAFSIAKRTVSRDLDVLDNWLSFRGASLERIPNQGIRVLTFGSSPDELLDILNTPESYLESILPLTRQKLILLYLLFNNREIKISTIANAFFISDTSVWSDLNTIEAELEGTSLYLERLKGVGLRLSGEESRIRLKFLTTITEVFSSHTIIPYLYTLKEDKGSFLEINQLKFLINRLNFPGSNNSILKVISETCTELGYQFTMSGEAMLYFYLQLTVHRIKSGALITSIDFSECIDYFRELGDSILIKSTDKVFSGVLPDAETKFLGLILQVLEIGDFAGGRPYVIEEMINSRLEEFTDDMITEFGKIDRRQYYFNSHMAAVLRFTIASLVMRLQNGIPVWHGEWGSSSSESWNRGEKAEVLSVLLKNRFQLTANKCDLDYILLYFQSMIFSNEDLPDKKVRCLVCCFEGIGLASYLQSILKREIAGLDVVEATAVFKIRQEYLDAHKIELVISTFPIGNLETPVLPISLPLNKEQFLKDISEIVSDVKWRNSISEPAPVEDETEKEEVFSFDDIIDFIQDFRILTLPDGDIENTIVKLSSELSGTRGGSKLLAEAFRKRENSGPLWFDEWGIRVLHCKSRVIGKPKAGVIEFDGGGRKRMIFMAAPDPCADQIRKMLSTITISFMENNQFRSSVISGSLNQIRKNLMDVYKEFV